MESPIASYELRFKGSGGLCYNPNNSRKTFKIIFPNTETDKLKRVELWTKQGEKFETLYRAKPNEYDNRARYYGKKLVKKYPKGIQVFLFRKDGEIGRCVVKDPKKRQD